MFSLLSNQLDAVNTLGASLADAEAHLFEDATRAIPVSGQDEEVNITGAKGCGSQVRCAEHASTLEKSALDARLLQTLRDLLAKGRERTDPRGIARQGRLRRRISHITERRGEREFNPLRSRELKQGPPTKARH